MPPFCLPKVYVAPLLSAERVCHITHHGKFTILHPRIHTGHINLANPDQIFAAAGKLFCVFIKKTYPQRPDTAHTAVVRGRSSDGDGNIPEPFVESVTYHLSCPVTRCLSRISLLLRHEGKSGSCRHLHDSPVFLQLAIGRSPLFPQRPMHVRFNAASSCGRHHCICCSLSTVGHSNAVALAVWKYLPRCLCQKPGCLPGGKGSFKRIRCK